MRQALELACSAGAAGEIPVGAVLVHCDSNGEWAVVSKAGNLKESTQDPLGHAELIAIRRAAATLGRWRLSNCELYVTLEPCAMCAGAIVHARLNRIIYGATDAKAGAVESLYRILSDSRLNHAPEITSGTLATECAEVLSTFFKRLRMRADVRSERKTSAPP